MSSLIDRGFSQGCVLKCQDIGGHSEFKKALEDGRAIPGKRNSPVEENHVIIVLSQDCDISNPNDKYIELATAKPSKGSAD